MVMIIPVSESGNEKIYINSTLSAVFDKSKSSVVVAVTVRA